MMRKDNYILEVTKDGSVIKHRDRVIDSLYRRTERLYRDIDEIYDELMFVTKTIEDLKKEDEDCIKF